VGPIPTADNVGKEVIVRTSTDLQTGAQLSPLLQLSCSLLLLQRPPSEYVPGGNALWVVEMWL
jgi:hypothetical protein